MSLSQLAIAGAALALLAPSAAKACGAPGFSLSKADMGVIAAIATVTLPIWIGPALVYGVAVGVKAGVDSAKDAVRPVTYNTSLTNDAQPRKMTTDEMRPFFDLRRGREESESSQSLPHRRSLGDRWRPRNCSPLSPSLDRDRQETTSRHVGERSASRLDPCSREPANG